MSLSENQMQDLDTWEHGNMIKTLTAYDSGKKTV